jgi:predicted nuclease with RNAse H fold
MWLGADPGGANAFGLALLRDDGTCKSVCVSCAEEALTWVEQVPKGVGIDAPMWWSAGRSGDRRADQWIRRTYGIRAGTVQAANSLRGAALVQGVLFAELLRRKFGQIPITEVHPKALILASGGVAALLSRYALVIPDEGQHTRDAAISAIAAREGFSGRWSRDLSLDRLPCEQDPSKYWLAPMRYFWPE